MTWLDWFSVIADGITFLGVPILVVSAVKLRRDLRKDRAEEAQRRIDVTYREIVGQGCLAFQNTNPEMGINLIPFEKLAAVPRPGDFVMLPGQTDNGKNLGAGEYEVERVSFSFQEAPKIDDQPCPAVPSKITVYVHRRKRN